MVSSRIVAVIDDALHSYNSPGQNGSENVRRKQMTGAGGAGGGAGGGGAGGAAGESRMPRKDGRLLVLPSPSPVNTDPQLCFVEYYSTQYR